MLTAPVPKSWQCQHLRAETGWAASGCQTVL